MLAKIDRKSAMDLKAIDRLVTSHASLICRRLRRL